METQISCKCFVMYCTYSGGHPCIIIDGKLSARWSLRQKRGHQPLGCGMRQGCLIQFIKFRFLASWWHWATAASATEIDVRMCQMGKANHKIEANNFRHKLLGGNFIGGSSATATVEAVCLLNWEISVRMAMNGANLKTEYWMGRISYKSLSWTVLRCLIFRIIKNDFLKIQRDSFWTFLWL